MKRQEEFDQLVKEWREQRPPSSFSKDLAMCFPYQRIIGMGMDALPLILTEMQSKPDHWFWALRAITGEDPVPYEDRGYIHKMTEHWLQWGEEHHLIKRSV